MLTNYAKDGTITLNVFTSMKILETEGKTVYFVSLERKNTGGETWGLSRSYF